MLTSGSNCQIRVDHQKAISEIFQTPENHHLTWLAPCDEPLRCAFAHGQSIDLPSRPAECSSTSCLLVCRRETCHRKLDMCGRRPCVSVHVHSTVTWPFHCDRILRVFLHSRMLILSFSRSLRFSDSQILSIPLNSWIAVLSHCRSLALPFLTLFCRRVLSRCRRL